jgi:MFS family permease
MLIFDSSGIIIGLAISILLISYIGFRSSLIFFSLVSFAGIIFYLKIKDDTRFKPNKIKKLKINKKIKLLAFAENSYWLALASSFVLVITFLLTEYFSSSIIWIAILFGTLNLTIVMSTLFTKTYISKFNYLKTSIFGVVLLFFSAIIIIYSTNIYFLLTAMILEGIGAGIWVPSKTAYLWKQISKEQRETVSAYVNGWRTFVGSIGPLVGGILVTYFGILSPFFFKAIICLIPISIYFYLLKLKN